MSDIVLSPSSATTVFAATLYNGTFTSTDGGATWANLGGEGAPGLVGEMVGGADGALYAALSVGRRGIHKSTDGGVTWTEVDDASVNCLAVDSTPTPAVYAGSRDGVKRSANGGVSWTESDTGIEGLTIQALAVDPTTPTTIYAGTSSSGVFKSTDSGATWTAANTGIESARVREIVIDPATPANLYVATSDIGIRMSKDAGVSWGAVGAGPPTDVETLALDPVTPATVFAGAFGDIFKSIDSGASWASLTLPVGGVRVDSLVVDPTTPTTVYAGTGAGVLKSTDGGTSWTETSSGLTAFYPELIVVDPVTPTTVYAASTASGIAKSTDSGATWQGANDGLPSREIVTNGVGLAIAPGSPDSLYASLESTIYRTIDGGASWSDALLNPAVFVSPPSVLTIAVDPVDPDTAFAGNFGSTFPMVDFGAGFYRTSDGGASWDRVYSAAPGSDFGTFQPTDMVIDPGDGNHVYAGVLYFPADPNGWGVFRTTDGGDSWEETLTGSETFRFPDLAVDPASGAVYASVTSGSVLELFKSTDQGATWTPIPVDPAFSCSFNVDLFADPSGSSSLFLNCLTSIELGTDPATTWHGLPGNGFAAPIDTDTGAIRGLGAAATTPRTLHAGTFGGIYSFTADLADLSITKTDGLSEVQPGPLTYTIEVENSAGPDDAVGAVVSDTLPTDVTCTWSCVASGGGSCTATPPAGNLADSVNLPVGGSALYTGTCTLAGGASGTVSNTAAVSAPAAGLTDYVTGNDNATDTTLVLEIGGCGEFDRRHLTNQVVTTTLVVSACTSIRADDGFQVDPSGIVTFIAPAIILGSDFSALGRFTAQNAVP